MNISELIARDIVCSSGKDVYKTYQDAQEMLRTRNGRGKDKAIYKCTICGYFHMTSKDGKFGRKHRRLDRTYSYSDNAIQKVSKGRKMNTQQLTNMYIENPEDIKKYNSHMKDRKKWSGYNVPKDKAKDAMVYSTAHISLEDILGEKVEALKAIK